MKMYSTYCQNKPLSDDITKDSEEEIAEVRTKF